MCFDCQAVGLCQMADANLWAAGEAGEKLGLLGSTAKEGQMTAFY